VLLLSISWIVYLYSSLITGEEDSGGTFYPKALKHLFFGIYTMDLSLISLLLLVRDNENKVKCIPQACLIALVLLLTLLFHLNLNKEYSLLVRYLPVSLSYKQKRDAFSFQPISSVRIHLPTSKNRVDFKVTHGDASFIQVDSRSGWIDSKGNVHLNLK
jgi:hypothetical protein